LFPSALTVSLQWDSIIIHFLFVTELRSADCLFLENLPSELFHLIPY
jgi:hypothetical protein